MRPVLRALTTIMASLVGLSIVLTGALTHAAVAADTGSISGTVTDTDGGALVGVYVSVYQRGAGATYWSQIPQSTSTNSAGQYEVVGLSAGTYRVGYAGSYGEYFGEYFENAASVESATDIVVGDGVAVTGKDAELASPSHVTGRVTGTGGVALSNINVTAYKQTPGWSGWSQWSTAQTNADGDYDMGGLQAGTYRLGFADQSGEHVSEFLDNSLSVDVARDLVVGESATISGTNAQLAAAAHITGTVTDSNGAALTDVRVQPYQWVPGMGYWGYAGTAASTSETGEYDLAGLRAGTYRLGFQDSSGEHFNEFFDNVTTLDAATGVTVAEGVTVTGKDAQLASPSHITGKVTGADGSGLSGVRVLAHSRDASGSWSSYPNGMGATTDASGDFDLGGLRSGRYRLQFIDQSGGHLGEYFDNAPTVDSATDILLGEGATAASKNAQLADAATIAGKVTDTSGVGLPSIQVTAYRRVPGWGSWSSMGSVSVQTNATGEFQLRGLAADTYRLGFSDSSGEFVTEYYEGATTVDTANDIVVGEGADLTDKSVQLALGSHIAGRVANADGVALRFVYVAAYRRSPSDGAWLQTGRQAETNSAGAYDLGGLPAGTYRLGFSTYSSDYAGEFYDNASSVESAQDIVVAEGVTVSGKDAELARTSHITGKITGTGGAGVQYAAVSAYQKLPGQGYWSPVGMAAYTNAAGEYDLGGLRAGTYRLGFSSMSGGYLSEFYDNVSSLEAATDVVVGEGVTVPGRNAQLAPFDQPEPAFLNTDLPSVTGTPEVGQVLTAAPGSWTPSGASFAYEWLADGGVISGATGATFAPGVEFVGQRIKVRVTASGTGMMSGVAVSPTTGAVAAAPTPTAEPTPTVTPTVEPTVNATVSPTSTPTSAPTPTAAPKPDMATQLAAIAQELEILGKPKVGKKVSVANLVTALRTTAAYKFQWYAGKTKIKKATKSSLKLTQSLRGKKVSVKVTITAGGVTRKVTLKLGKVR